MIRDVLFLITHVKKVSMFLLFFNFLNFHFLLFFVLSFSWGEGGKRGEGGSWGGGMA